MINTSEVTQVFIKKEHRWKVSDGWHTGLTTMFLNIMLGGRVFVFCKLLVSYNQAEKKTEKDCESHYTRGKKNQFSNFSQDDLNLKKLGKVKAEIRI